VEVDQGKFRIRGAIFPGLQLQEVNPLIQEVAATREQESHVLGELDAGGKNQTYKRVGKRHIFFLEN